MLWDTYPHGPYLKETLPLCRVVYQITLDRYRSHSACALSELCGTLGTVDKKQFSSYCTVLPLGTQQQLIKLIMCYTPFCNHLRRKEGGVRKCNTKKFCITEVSQPSVRNVCLLDSSLLQLHEVAESPTVVTHFIRYCSFVLSKASNRMARRERSFTIREQDIKTGCLPTTVMKRTSLSKKIRVSCLKLLTVLPRK